MRSTLLMSLLCISLSYPTLLFADGESDQLAHQKAQLEDEINRMSAELASTEEDLRAKQRELDQLAQTEQNLIQEIARQEKDEAAIDAETEGLRRMLVDTIASRDAARQKIEAYQLEITDLKIKEAAERQRMETITEENNQLKELSEALEREIDEKSAETLKLTEEINAANASLSEDRQLLEELRPEEFAERLDTLKARWTELKSQNFGRAAGDLPLTAIGRLNTPQGTCTAFLVAPDRIRTAAHCVQGIDKLSEMTPYTFVSADGTAVGILYQTRYSERADLIELKLRFNVELETVEAAALDPGLALERVAYDIMSGEIVNQSCRVLDYQSSSGLIKSDCSSGLGMSGAPLFQNGKVVAFHLGKLGPHSVAMVFEPLRDQGLSNGDAAEIQYEYNCDSDCKTEIKIPYSCPTLRRPGRICHKIQTSPDPVCEAAKQHDCAVRATQREAERVLNRLKEELRNGLESLGIKREQTKISLDGLKKTLSDIGDATMGRNQSVKDLQDRLLANAARIDRKRAELTQAALMLDEIKGITGKTLETLGASERDIAKLKSFFDEAEGLQSKLVLDQKTLREAVSKLELQKSSLAKKIASQKLDLDSINLNLKKLHGDGTLSLRSLTKKIGEMPEALTVPILGAISFDKEGKPQMIAALRNLEAYLDKKGPELEKWIKARFKEPKTKHCEFQDVESQSKCLQNKKQELEKLRDQMKGQLDNFHNNIQKKLKEGSAL